jgi:hypothetical protein
MRAILYVAAPFCAITGLVTYAYICCVKGSIAIEIIVMKAPKVARKAVCLVVKISLREPQDPRVASS